MGIIGFGTISGGVASSLTGGNFWQGAATAFVVSVLNHWAHQGKQNDPKKELARRIVKEYGGNLKEVEDFLSAHPLVEKDGIVSFEGIDNLSLNVKDIFKGNTSDDSSFNSAKSLVQKIGSQLVKKFITGGGFLLSDGGLGKDDVMDIYTNKKNMELFKINYTKDILLMYMFKPQQGVSQTPSMLNGMSNNTGKSRFEFFYKHM